MCPSKISEAAVFPCAALQKLRCESFDDLEPEIGGFALEIVNLLFAVLPLVKRFASIDEWYPMGSMR
jgi:hypothetical protein